MTSEKTSSKVATTQSNPVGSGCVRCRPEPVKSKAVPQWFFGSKAKLTELQKQSGLQESDLERKPSYNISEEERLARVHDWLRRSCRGVYGDSRDAEGRANVKDPSGNNKYNVDIPKITSHPVGAPSQSKPKAKGGRSLADVKNWYNNKVTRTSVTSLYSLDKDKEVSWKPERAARVVGQAQRLEPIEQQSGASSSYNSGAVAAASYSRQPEASGRPAGSCGLPDDDPVRQYLARRQMMESCRPDRSFTHRLQMGQLHSTCRRDAGPITRPYTPVRSLAARQRSTLGNETWFGQGKPRMEEVHKLQSRTYELQAQLQQMLDRQKSK